MCTTGNIKTQDLSTEKHYQISYPHSNFLLSETPLFSLIHGNEKMTSGIFPCFIGRLKISG